MGTQNFFDRYEQVREYMGAEAPFGLPENSPNSMGLNIWARSMPKTDVFDQYARFGQSLGTPINVYIDDACARMVTGRTDEQQTEINQHYIDYFSDKTDNLHFSSDIVEPVGLDRALAVTKNLALLSFEKDILPEKKRGSADLQLSEVGHAVMQILLLEEIAKQESILLSGKFSLGIIYAARKTMPTFPKVITLDRIPT